MGKKVRKQFTLTEEQAAALAREAQRQGISEAEMLRRMVIQMCAAPIDLRLDTPALFAGERADVSEEAQHVQDVDDDGGPLPKTMDELIAWMRARAEKYPGTNQPRTWKREDAYEGRI